MDNIINTLNLEKFNNFIPYIGDTKYLIIIFGAIFLTIFIVITMLTKKNAIKKNKDVVNINYHKEQDWKVNQQNLIII